MPGVSVTADTAAAPPSRGRSARAPDLRRADARPAARVPRPDDRLHRAADDRRRARRDRAPLVGRHGVPARVDDRRAAVREARRPLRPQDRPADGDRDLPRRLGALRAGAGHGPADRLSCDPGDRRRRPDRDDHGRRRRHRAAARARQVPGAVRCRLRRLDGDRPAARRLLRREPLLAVDLLHQPSARDRLARRSSRRHSIRGRRRSATRSTTSARRSSPPGSRRSCSSRASAGRPGHGNRPRASPSW